jgi:threonine/homoserine/homoserine lactone efflux protein
VASRRRRAAFVALGIVLLCSGLAIAVLVGLDTADKLASVAGALLGIVGLMLTIWTALDRAEPDQAERGGAEFGPRLSIRMKARASRNSIVKQSILDDRGDDAKRAEST